MGICNIMTATLNIFMQRLFFDKKDKSIINHILCPCEFYRVKGNDTCRVMKM